MIRSNFQHERFFRDRLGLGAVIDTALHELSSRGRSAPLIFVDTADFPDAYALVGRYLTEEDKLRVAVRVFRGEDLIGEFNVTGDEEDLQELTRRILEKTERLL
jgi:hypothetical protein